MVLYILTVFGFNVGYEMNSKNLTNGRLHVKESVRYMDGIRQSELREMIRALKLFQKLNRRSADQEIRHYLWKPKVHFRLHKSPPLIPIQMFMNPAHISHSTSLRSTLILSSHLRLCL
jgi:hypothetical protein